MSSSTWRCSVAEGVFGSFHPRHCWQHKEPQLILTSNVLPTPSPSCLSGHCQLPRLKTLPPFRAGNSEAWLESGAGRWRSTRGPPCKAGCGKFPPGELNMISESAVTRIPRRIRSRLENDFSFLLKIFLLWGRSSSPSSMTLELSSCLGSQASPGLAIPMPPSYRVSLAWRHAPAGMQE